MIKFDSSLAGSLFIKKNMNILSLLTNCINSIDSPLKQFLNIGKFEKMLISVIQLTINETELYRKLKFTFNKESEFLTSIILLFMKTSVFSENLKENCIKEKKKDDINKLMQKYGNNKNKIKNNEENQEDENENKEFYENLSKDIGSNAMFYCKLLSLYSNILSINSDKVRGKIAQTMDVTITNFTNKNLMNKFIKEFFFFQNENLLESSIVKVSILLLEDKKNILNIVNKTLDISMYKEDYILFLLFSNIESSLLFLSNYINSEFLIEAIIPFIIKNVCSENMIQLLSLTDEKSFLNSICIFMKSLIMLLKFKNNILRKILIKNENLTSNETSKEISQNEDNNYPFNIFLVKFKEVINKKSESDKNNCIINKVINELDKFMENL